MSLWSAIGGALYSVGLQTGVINPMCIKGKDENGNEICINPNSPPPTPQQSNSVSVPFYQQDIFWIAAGITVIIVIVIVSKRK